MDLDNISDELYKLLYNRIKTDLYSECINHETATYGADVLRQQEAKEDIYSDIVSEKEIIWDEIQQLQSVMKRYEDDEEYVNTLEYSNEIYLKTIRGLNPTLREINEMDNTTGSVNLDINKLREKKRVILIVKVK